MKIVQFVYRSQACSVEWYYFGSQQSQCFRIISKHWTISKRKTTPFTVQVSLIISNSLWLFKSLSFSYFLWVSKSLWVSQRPSQWVPSHKSARNSRSAKFYGFSYGVYFFCYELVSSNRWVSMFTLSILPFFLSISVAVDVPVSIYRHFSWNYFKNKFLSKQFPIISIP